MKTEAVQCRPATVMKTTASSSALTTSAAREWLCSSPPELLLDPLLSVWCRLLGHQAAAVAEGEAKALGMAL